MSPLVVSAALGAVLGAAFAWLSAIAWSPTSAEPPRTLLLAGGIVGAVVGALFARRAE